MRSRVLAPVLTVATCTLVAAGPVSAAAPEERRAQARSVDVGIFYQSLPLLAAQRKGFFRRAGLDVRYRQVTSSTQQEWGGFDTARDTTALARPDSGLYRRTAAGRRP